MRNLTIIGMFLLAGVIVLFGQSGTEELTREDEAAKISGALVENARGDGRSGTETIDNGDADAESADDAGPDEESV